MGGHRKSWLRKRIAIPKQSQKAESLSLDGTNGEAIDVGTIRKLSRALGVALSELLEEDPIPALHQMRPPPGDFTGREEDLQELLDAVQKEGRAILAIRGMGGVGKTALALTLAERLAPEFPDAQLFLDLKGVSWEPTSPRAAMERVIHSFSPGHPVPNDEDLGPRYRDSLHRKRAIILLDNARDEQQVSSLEPPSGCVLLITSRQRFVFPGLYTKDLSSLSRREACAFLLRLEPRIDRYANALADLCGDLPLALRTAAMAIAARADLVPAEYIRRLWENRERLEPVEAAIGSSDQMLLTID